jgi:hypothetical protein
VKRWIASTLAPALLAACELAPIEDSRQDPGGSRPPVDAARQLQPLALGTTWTYETHKADGSDRTRKEVAVVDVEEVDGISAAVVESVRGESRTRVWLAVVDDRVVRLREEKWTGGALVDRRVFSPGSLRTPVEVGSLRVGEVLDGAYVEKALGPDDRVIAERSRTPSYRVEAIGEEVVTPAGTFFALKLRKLGDDGDDGDGKLVWYAPGVGKVREEGGRIEVLQSYSLP